VEYRTNDITFTLLGSGWEDRSIHRLSLAAPDGRRVAFDVLRADPVASAAALAARVEADLAGHRRHLRGFELVERAAFEAQGARGEMTTFRALGPEGAEHHAIAYLPLREALLLLRAWSALANAGACQEILRGAIASVRLTG
jgi:hypothetical protein